MVEPTADEQTEEVREAGSAAVPPDLQEEARRLREQLRRAAEQRSAARFPLWRKIFYGTFVVGSIGAAAFLLSAGETRRAGIEVVAADWLGLYRDSSQEVFPLPPPPPKETTPTTRAEIVASYSDEGFEGVLYADLDPESPLEPEEAQSGEAGAAGFVPPPRTAEAERAFALLQSQSPVMADLVGGRLEGYEFQDWNPVRIDPPNFYIDVVAKRTDSSEVVHLVWSIQLESESVRPLSQAARDVVSR